MNLYICLLIEGDYLGYSDHNHNYNGNNNAFQKSLRKSERRGKKKGKRWKKNNSKNGKKNGGEESYIRCYCSRCGKLLKKEKHHIFPQWIFKLLKILGLIAIEEVNNDTVPLCPECHHQIEMINQKFAAVKMQKSRRALAEIFQRFLNREHISDKYIVYMATKDDSTCSISEQAVIVSKQTKEVEV